MTITGLPIPKPIRLNPSDVDGKLHKGCQEKLITVTNLLYANCARVRAAIVLLQRVNSLLPPIDLAAKDDLAYADQLRDSLALEQPWRRMAAREAAFGADNFRFLLQLLAERPAEFGFDARGHTAVEIARSRDAFGKDFPEIKEIRDAVAHVDQIFRQKSRNAIDSSIVELNAKARKQGEILISDSMIDDNYIVTKEGRSLELSATPRTYEKLYSTYCSVSLQLDR